MYFDAYRRSLGGEVNRVPYPDKVGCAINLVL